MWRCGKIQNGGMVDSILLVADSFLIFFSEIVKFREASKLNLLITFLFFCLKIRYLYIRVMFLKDGHIIILIEWFCVQMILNSYAPYCGKFWINIDVFYWTDLLEKSSCKVVFSSRGKVLCEHFAGSCQNPSDLLFPFWFCFQLNLRFLSSRTKLYPCPNWILGMKLFQEDLKSIIAGKKKNSFTLWANLALMD